MKTPEAEIFGFPNSLLGLVTFGAIIAAGGAILLGQRFKPLFWWALIAGQFAGVVMVHFLMYTSIIVLQALCPWCVLTWFATIPTFVLTCAYAVSGGFVKLPAIIRSTAENAAHYYPLVLLGWMGVIIVAMLLKFLI